jgi:hypothetical protein
MKGAMTRWIRSNIRSHRQVRACWIIGSVLDSRKNFNDIDIMLSLNVWDVRRWLVRRKVAFYLTFHKRLDIQIFHRTQVREIRRFLVWAGRTTEV